MRPLVSTVAAIVAVLLGTSSASALDEHDIDPFAGITPAQELPTEPVPYVPANSTQEAIELLDAMEAQQSAGISRASLSVGPCVLYPSTIHWRTSSGNKSVGQKPYTRCSVPVSRIHHTTELRYQYFLTWKIAKKKSGGNYNQKNYTQKNVEHFCTGKTGTTFKGTTLGKIVYRGKTYYSRVYTPPARFGCRV